MTKMLKTLIALTLAFAMCFSLTSTAFASEVDHPEGIPENAVRHEVQVTLMPEGYTEEDYEAEYGGGAQTYVWANPSMNLIYHHTANTASFYITDKYFAYETMAIPVSGTATSQTYAVALMYASGGVRASMANSADGNYYKYDWITIDSDDTFCFRVTNNTDYVLSIDIIYYTWN